MECKLLLLHRGVSGHGMDWFDWCVYHYLIFRAALIKYKIKFQIKDIQETDAGYYQCQVIIAVSNKINAEVELQVRRPPIISDNSTRSAIVSEGQMVNLECYSGGYPPPRVSWRRENNAILPTGGSIYRCA